MNYMNKGKNKHLMSPYQRKVNDGNRQFNLKGIMVQQSSDGLRAFQELQVNANKLAQVTYQEEEEYGDEEDYGSNEETGS